MQFICLRRMALLSCTGCIALAIIFGHFMYNVHVMYCKYLSITSKKESTSL